MIQLSAKLDKEDITILRVRYPGLSVAKAFKRLIADSDALKEGMLSQKDIFKLYDDKLTSYIGKLETRLKKVIGEF